jgi:hypothetical protein
MIADGSLSDSTEWVFNGRPPTPWEESVFAIIAAVLFAIAFILQLIGKASGNLNWLTFELLGLVFLALHFAPLGTVRSRRWRR